MNKPSPALVTQRAVRRLPRTALLLFCTAYVLPGLFGRDPWKNADVSAVGYMARLAAGLTEWLHPALAGLPAEGGLVPYWLGAISIKLLTPWLSLSMAARVPFGLLLAAALTTLWYACFHFARRVEAQPLAFAFGGEAHPVDYARAIADGALLGLIANLGLLQLGHETTPELVQLFGMTWWLYGLAASPARHWRARLALLLAPALLAASGAPTTAVLLGVAATTGLLTIERPSATTSRPTDTPHAHLFTAAWMLLGTGMAAAVAIGLDTWHWRLSTPASALAFPHLFVWFTWPVWPMVAWTLWQWRRHWLHPHIAWPTLCALTCIGVSIGMGSNDRALMLALPGMAVLAAFALPTLQRSVSAAVDWFSVLFFSGWALTFWGVYLSMHTGVPRQPAQNVVRLLPGFVPQFHALGLLLALLGTGAWIWLVAWRTGKHRHPLWKSLVLPAGGVALNWLLAMSLLLPPLDYARSFRSLMDALAAELPTGGCIYAGNLSRAQIAAMEVIGHWHVAPQQGPQRCNWMVMSLMERENALPPDGWTIRARVYRPTNREESLVVLGRLQQVP